MNFVLSLFIFNLTTFVSYEAQYINHKCDSNSTAFSDNPCIPSHYTPAKRMSVCPSVYKKLGFCQSAGGSIKSHLVTALLVLAISELLCFPLKY